MKLPLAIICILFLSSCAHIVTPTGGPKDINPPQVLNAEPENYSINFNSSEIAIAFDEYLQLKDLNNQLIISPPLKEAPEIAIKKKSIQINFSEDLKENTTYTVNFGSSIADITENNVLENFQYVFSTTSYTDSLYVKGKATLAHDLSAEKGIFVMLYKDSLINDSLPYKTRPAYVTKTDAHGNFKINNVASGIYKIIALKDVNSNYLFDQPNESIGFLNNSIELPKDSTIELFLFQEASAKQYLVKAYAAQAEKIVFIFNKPVQDLFIDLLNFPGSGKRAWELKEFSNNRDTIYYWYTDIPLDTLRILIKDNEQFVDTVNITLFNKDQDPRKLRGRSSDTPALNIQSNIKQGVPFDLVSPIQLTLSHPIKFYDLKKTLLTEEDSIITNYKIEFKDTALRKFEIYYPWKENKTYELLIPEKTFTDIFDLSNDTVRISFKTKSLDDYGSILIKLGMPDKDHNYILQLQNEKGETIKEDIVKETTINFNYLRPAKYKLKMIYDRNNNLKWDTGNYLKKFQPEKVSYYSELLNVRANWDIEAEWILKE